jgi:hypothetical protein
MPRRSVRMTVGVGGHHRPDRVMLAGCAAGSFQWGWWSGLAWWSRVLSGCAPSGEVRVDSATRVWPDLLDELTPLARILVDRSGDALGYACGMCCCAAMTTRTAA